MRIEVHWGEKSMVASANTLELIMAGLPRRDEVSSPFGDLFGGTQPSEDNILPTDVVGNTIRTDPKPKPCRACGGRGSVPGIGYPFGCSRCYRPPRSRNRGAISSAIRGGGRSRRP